MSAHRCYNCSEVINSADVLCGEQIWASLKILVPVPVLVPLTLKSAKETWPLFRVLGYRPVDLPLSLNSCTTGSRSHSQVRLTYVDFKFK